MYKLCAIDIDGTLLNSQGEVTEDTIKAINQCKDNGVKVILSTGRPIQGIKKYMDLLDLSGPHITYNGAMIVGEDRKVIYQVLLNQVDAEKIYQLGQDKGLSMIVWSENQLYGNKDDLNVRNYQKLSGVEPVIIHSFDDLKDKEITKIIWIDEATTIQKIQKSLNKDQFSEVNFVTSKPHFLEFFSAKVSKGKALEMVGKSLIIRRDQIVAIGDGENDLEMIQYAGLGIAMSNGAEIVKEHADIVTDSNDEDGLAKALRKLISFYYVN